MNRCSPAIKLGLDHAIHCAKRSRCIAEYWTMKERRACLFGRAIQRLELVKILLWIVPRLVSWQISAYIFWKKRLWKSRMRVRTHRPRWSHFCESQSFVTSSTRIRANKLDSIQWSAGKPIIQKVCADSHDANSNAGLRKEAGGSWGKGQAQNCKEVIML